MGRRRFGRLAILVVLVAGCLESSLPITGGSDGGSPADGGSLLDAGTDARPLGDGSASFDARPDTERPDADDLDCSAPPSAAGPTVDLGGPAIFWTECNVVRAANLDGTGATTIATGQFPTGVALDLTAQKIYWADNLTDAITRANLDGGSSEVVYRSLDPFANPNGLAVDPANGRLFWTEFSAPPTDGGDPHGFVKTAGLDGGGPRVLYQGTFPLGVAVAPSVGSVHFTDNGTDTITRGDVDGGVPVVIHTATDRFANPGPIAIDPTRGLVFWGEVGAVFRSLEDGGSRTRIADAGHSDGITVDPASSFVYFTDNETDTIRRIAYDGAGTVVLHTSASRFANPRGVAVRP